MTLKRSSFQLTVTKGKESIIESGHTHRSVLMLVAALAVTVAGGLSLGAGTAYADEVLPGLTCDDFDGIITCTNTTNTDYTIVQTKQCAGGDRSSTDYGYMLNPVTGHYDNSPKMSFHSTEPSVEIANVFVPARNSGIGLNGCDYHADRISYSVAPPPPPAA
jgi:hypothetical protein